MILHLVHDDKITNRIITHFEKALPNQNLFLICVPRQPYQYVKMTKHCISYQDFITQEKLIDFSQVIVHSLNLRKRYILNHYIPKDIPVYWIIWKNYLYNQLLAPKGFILYDKDNPFTKGSWITRKLKPYKKWQAEREQKAMTIFIEKRVNFLLSDTTENDVDQLIKLLPSLANIPSFPFFYYTLDELLDQTQQNTIINGSNILLGCSCSPTNNHTYAMKTLSKLDLGNRKVFVPLSYSIDKSYLKKVMTKGKQEFKKNFNPLTEFLPLNEYNQLLQSVNVAIYGNFIPEAFKSICVSLYLGAKVFLPKQNPLHQWAKSCNIKLFNLEELTQYELDTPLSEKIRLQHRTILSEQYSLKRLLELIQNTWKS